MGMLVPVIGLVQVGGQAMADRYTYLPQIGLLIALAWLAKDSLVSWPYRTLAYGVSATLILGVLMGCAWRQTTYWHDGETLWSHAVDVTPYNATAHFNYGNILADHKKTEAAIAHYRTALQLQPKNGDVYNNLGNLLTKVKRYDEAIEDLRIAIQFDPKDAFAHNNLGLAFAYAKQPEEAIDEYRKALALKPGYVTALDNLGLLLQDEKRLDEAGEVYEQSLKFEPEDADVCYNMGVVRINQGRIDDAIAYFRRVLELKPTYVLAYHNLGVLTSGRGQLDEAIACFGRAAQLDSKNPSSRNLFDEAMARREQIKSDVAAQRELLREHPDDVNLLNRIAWTLATNPTTSIRNGAEAVQLAGRAVQLSQSRNSISLGILAAAYAETGQYAKAVESQQQALALAANENNAKRIDSLRARLKVYQAGSPYRDIPPPPTPNANHP